MEWNPFFGTRHLLTFNNQIMKKYIILLCTAAFLTACSSPKYATTPQNLKYKVNGFYANVDVKNTFKNVTGEIIEVGVSEIKLLHEGTLQSFQKDQVKSSEILVSLTVNDPKKINTWASLVNLGPLGHGVFGIITIPINVAVTNSITKSRYVLIYPDNITWEELHKFARFPQGIPKNLDTKKLQ